MDAQALHRSYRFDRFELLVAQRLLLSDGKALRLGMRALDVLIALVSHAGQVVSRAQLLEAAWPGLVVEEGNVMVQVFTLRQLLGREAIASVPGRGYRFCLRVHAPGDAPKPRHIEVEAARPSVAVELSAVSASATLLSPLPAPPAVLFGREADLRELAEQLQRHRLVTVVGASGIGKTALVLAVVKAQGTHPEAPVAWVDLSDTDQGARLPRLVAQALGLPATADEDPLPRLVTQLQSMALLLVIDNAEHVDTDVARLAHALLVGCTHVRLMVTSQKPLKVLDECVFRLEPLSVPEPASSPEQAITHGAVALFVEQARLLDRRFLLDSDNVAQVIALCRQLDGVALAIQLAASRVPALGVDKLGERMRDRFTLLERSKPADTPWRHMTLRAALDWSHGLLGDAERRVFRRLGVFVGGFTLGLVSETAQDGSLDVWGVEDALEGLVDRSLVVVDDAPTPRYRLLDSTRSYALLMLEEAAETQATRAQHVRAVTALCVTASARYSETGDLPWLATYAADIDNVRAALDWSFEHEPDACVALLGESSDMFSAMSLFQESRERYRACVALVHDGLPGRVLANYWLGQSRLLFTLDQRAARDFVFKAIDFYRAEGNTRQLYLALGQAVHIVAFSSTAEARRMLEELVRIEQASWPPRVRRVRKVVEAFVLTQEGEPAQACEALQAALALAREAGAPRMASSDLSSLTSAYMSIGQAGRAVALGRELVAGLRPQADITRLMALGNLTAALLADANPADARVSLAEFFEMSQRLAGDGFTTYADVYAHLAASEGRWADAARLLGYADHVFAKMGQRFAIAQAIRAQVWALLGGQLEPGLVDGLMTEGAAMSAGDVRLHALEAPAVLA